MRDTLLSILLQHLKPSEALTWLEQPNRMLDGKTPAVVIVEEGYDQVIRVARAVASEILD